MKVRALGLASALTPTATGSVDFDGLPAGALKSGGQAAPGEQRARDAAASPQRADKRRNPAAAVARQSHVGGEQRLQLGEIVLLGGHISRKARS
ncbi:MAG TPA: hypothetical protein VFW38_05220 [Solirubrobacteraceae bacterium]|nr:hypothetical protein [Solirubrobacteraceae bacterium]